MADARVEAEKMRTSCAGLVDMALSSAKATMDGEKLVPVLEALAASIRAIPLPR